MQISDVIFYGLGAAVVVGVSGLVDFGSLFGSKSDAAESPDEPESESNTADAEAVIDRSERGEYQSTLAFFLDEDHASLVSARQEELSQSIAPDDVAETSVSAVDEEPAQDAPDDHVAQPQADQDDDNIFGDVTMTDEDALYEAQDRAGSQRPLAVYDLTDPATEAAYLDGFDATEEAIRIEYLPSFDPETGFLTEPELAVSYDADLDLTTISLDGATVAELDGDAGLSAADIELVPMEAKAQAA